MSQTKAQKTFRPKYVLEATESVKIPKNKYVGFFKNIIIVLSLMLLAASLMFGSRIYENYNWLINGILAAIIFISVLYEENDFIPFPIKFTFYPDRVEIERDFVYYDEYKKRKEVSVFNYTDIGSCVYNKTTNRVIIRGLMKISFYNYDESGEAKVFPDISKIDRGACYFHPNTDSNINIIDEIEKYSPIKFAIK